MIVICLKVDTNYSVFPCGISQELIISTNEHLFAVWCALFQKLQFLNDGNCRTDH